jgi:hypothetical protein
MKEEIFEVQSFREIPNPFTGKKDVGDIGETKMFFMIVDIKKLPKQISTKTNPREQNMNTNVAKAIQKGLRDSDFNDFYLLNRGILISAKDVSYDMKKREATILFDDDELHGIVDGGHTYRAIIENREDVVEQQYVKIEVLTGIENLFERLAGARNTSVQVKDKSLAELENKFDIIKDGIANEPYSDNIAYKENEDKNILIDDVLSILNMFDIDRYDGVQNPVSSYSSKSSCIKNYLEHFKKYGNTSNNPYNKMKPIMGTIFRLFDKLEREIGEYYQTAVKDGRYGRTKGVESSNGKRAFYAMISEDRIDYKSPKSFLYPVLAAFRALVVEEMGSYKFVIDPNVVMDQIGPELVRLTVERCRTLGNNPNAVGKDGNHWSQLYDKVDLYRLKNM